MRDPECYHPYPVHTPDHAREGDAACNHIGDTGIELSMMPEEEVPLGPFGNLSRIIPRLFPNHYKIAYRQRL